MYCIDCCIYPADLPTHYVDCTLTHAHEHINVNLFVYSLIRVVVILCPVVHCVYMLYLCLNV